MIDRVCENCGKLFRARRADVNRGWGRFCSKRCKAIEQERRTGQYRRYQKRQGNLLEDYPDNDFLASPNF